MALFDDLDIAALVATEAEQAADSKQARAMAMQSKRDLRRAKSEAVLSEILPADLAEDTSYHVISHGDIDALSYLRHIVRRQPLDWAYISTWCMAADDVREIGTWLADGKIGRVSYFVGEIFPNQYIEAFQAVEEQVAKFGGRCVIARNHSKVMLAANETSGYFAAIESSANVNTNPRIEQTAIHRSEDLLRFYQDFFDDLVSYDRTNKPGRIRPA